MYSDHHTKSLLSREVLLTSESQDLTKESSGTTAPISTSAHNAPISGNSSRSHAIDNSDSSHISHGGESELMKESSAVSTRSEASEGHQQPQPQPLAPLSLEPASSNSVHDGDDKQVHKKQTLQQMRGLPDLYLYRTSPGSDMSGSTATTMQDNSRGNNEQQGQGQGHSLSSKFHSNRSQQQQQQQQQDVNVTQEPLVRPPEPRSRVAMLQPLLAVAIHQEPLASITFREDAIMTSDRRGHIKVWKRPSNTSVPGMVGVAL